MQELYLCLWLRVLTILLSSLVLHRLYKNCLNKVHTTRTSFVGITEALYFHSVWALHQFPFLLLTKLQSQWKLSNVMKWNLHTSIRNVVRVSHHLGYSPNTYWTYSDSHIIVILWIYVTLCEKYLFKIMFIFVSCQI